MSDKDDTTSSDDTTAAETPDESLTPDEPTAPTAAPTPSPRPRSAASRARRIGGAAAAPRPDAEDATSDAKAAAKSDAKADAPTVNIGKKAGKASTKSADNTDGKADGKAGSKVAGKVAGKPAKGSDDEEKKPAAAALTFSIPGWVRWAPGFVFAAVAVVFLSLFAVAQLGGDDAPDSTSSSTRQEVLAAAKTCLATLNTYRYDQLTQAETAGTRCTTGKLTTDYKRTVTTVIRKNAPPLKAVQLAKINAAGIESVTKNGKQWTILAYGQLNITTANTGKQGRIDPFAVVARMQQVKDKWVISKVDTVSSFSQ